MLLFEHLLGHLQRGNVSETTDCRSSTIEMFEVEKLIATVSLPGDTKSSTVTSFGGSSSVGTLGAVISTFSSMSSVLLMLVSTCKMQSSCCGGGTRATTTVGCPGVTKPHEMIDIKVSKKPIL